jgi:hypothetical protein
MSAVVLAMWLPIGSGYAWWVCYSLSRCAAALERQAANGESSVALTAGSSSCARPRWRGPGRWRRDPPDPLLLTARLVGARDAVRRTLGLDYDARIAPARKVLREGAAVTRLSVLDFATRAAERAEGPTALLILAACCDEIGGGEL